MSDFKATDLGFSQMSVEDIDKIATEKGGVVGRIGYGFSLPGIIQPNHDWTAKWINSQGMGNHGTLILVPLSERTRGLRNGGIIGKWVASGLTKSEAEELYRMRDVQYKFELAPVLGRVLHDPIQLGAYFAHPGGYGPGTGRNRWREKWESVLDPQLSAPREQSLVTMLHNLYLR